MSDFKDHFSSDSASYRKFRPDYPAGIYDYLSDLCPNHELAWDCATGNGQCALGLAPFFKQVVATDASRQQIQQAKPVAGVQYRVATAEESGLPDNSVDLVSVAQALHWFDLQAFTKELQRVMKKDALLVTWCYNLLSINPKIDTIVNEFYGQTLNDYWPSERRLLEQGYAGIDFPFNELEVDSFIMAKSWSLDQLIGYLATWSAYKRYREKNENDPLLPLKERLQKEWGAVESRKSVRWPLSFRIWQK